MLGEGVHILSGEKTAWYNVYPLCYFCVNWQTLCMLGKGVKPVKKLHDIMCIPSVTFARKEQTSSYHHRLFIYIYIYAFSRQSDFQKIALQKCTGAS